MSDFSNAIGRLAVAWAFALASSGASASAQPSPVRDPATAQALFEEGKTLVQAGHYAEACPKLAESQRLDPADGTMFLLALCHEGEGKTATAWAEFNDAVTAARRSQRADRETASAEHVRVLEPKLTRLRLVVAVGADDVSIRRDGVPIGRAQWSTAVPVDPGAHTFVASAPGKQTWISTLEIVGEGRTVDVAVPTLKPEVPAPAPAFAPAPAPAPAPTPASAPTDGVSQKVWGLVVGGVGVAAAAVGLGIGASASSKWHEVEQACPGLKCSTANDIAAGQWAGKTADVATGFVVVGGVALAVGAVLYLAAPASVETRTGVRFIPLVDRRSAGLGIGGRL